LAGPTEEPLLEGIFLSSMLMKMMLIMIKKADVDNDDDAQDDCEHFDINKYDE
jgi:hypothetical protein